MLSPPLQRLLFGCEDYRDFLRSMISQNALHRGYQTRLAQSAGCQAAYLSHVLSGRAEFTPEHAEKLISFWDLGDEEGEYFFQLVHLARAGTPGLKQRIRNRLSEVKAKWQKKIVKHNKPELDEEDRARLYYKSWRHSAVHILSSISKLNTIDALANALKLPKKEIEEVIEDLQKIGMITKTTQGWKPTQASIHAEQSSYYAETHHKNWRSQAYEARRGPNNFRFTMVQSLSRKDQGKICDLIEELVQNSNRIIERSAEETGSCLIIDYFDISQIE